MLEGYLIRKRYPKQSENTGEGIEELIIYTQVCKHGAGELKDDCYCFVIDLIKLTWFETYSLLHLWFGAN